MTERRRKKNEPNNRHRIEKLLATEGHEVSPWRIFKIMAELVFGFEFLARYEKAATFFGSARNHLDKRTYAEATKLAHRLSKDGFAIITGGGPGIMEAANKGAKEAGGHSVGLNIKLRYEQRINPYVMESTAYHYFFVRKLMLAFSSQVYVFFPGGFGTLDEFFELTMLAQTKKIKPIPIILIGKDYWAPLLDWIERDVYGRYKAIDKKDMELYHLVDGADEACKVIHKLMKEKKPV